MVKIAVKYLLRFNLMTPNLACSVTSVTRARESQLLSISSAASGTVPGENPIPQARPLDPGLQAVWILPDFDSYEG